MALCVIQVPTAAPCQEMLTVRATSAIPDAVIEYVANVSQPYQVTINAGEHPAKTIRNICGALTEAFAKAFNKHNKDFHWGPHPTPRTVNMLACLKWRRDIPPVKLLPGEKTLDQVLERVIGVTSGAKVSCAANDPPSRCNFTYKELVQQLNPGSNPNNLTVTSIRLPLSTEPSTFTVRTGPTAVEVQAEINRLVAQHGGADALIYNQLAANISLMTAVSTDNEACDPSSADPAQHWPYDAKAVRAVL